MRRINPRTKTAAKKPIDRTLLVGPGSYDPKPVFTCPAYSMLSRPAQKSSANAVPGPGEYAPEKALTYLYPPLAKSISATVPEIKQGVPTDTPGPGAYNPRCLDTVLCPK